MVVVEVVGAEWCAVNKYETGLGFSLRRKIGVRHTFLEETELGAFLRRIFRFDIAPYLMHACSFLEVILLPYTDCFIELEKSLNAYEGPKRRASA